MAKCGAKTRSGGKCKQPGTGAGGRCKFHGGASPVGLASPNWRHGRHSKHLPQGLAAKYQLALQDPNLNSLRSEMALADVRIGEMLDALGETGNAKLWREARSKLDAFKSAGTKGKGSVGAARVALQQLDDLITDGLKVAATWDDLREWLELRRKLSESETKREKDLLQLVPVNQLHTFLAVFMTEVKTVVPDAKVLTHLSGFLSRLVGATGSIDAGAST